MRNPHTPDWDPYSTAACDNQAAVHDELRQRCPVAYSDALGWSLFQHDDVSFALREPGIFSNVVSTHASVPNGMDPPQHTAYRRLIDPYFSPQRMAVLEPTCREIARTLVDALPTDGEVDVNAEFADEFALQSQCAFLGWPVELHRPLREWVKSNHAATRQRDRASLAALAFEFDRHIRAVLDARRAQGGSGRDIVSQLLQEQINDRMLLDDEIISILRNWTVGELATIAACIGILLNFLAEHLEVQEQLRSNRALLPAAIDEILRLEAPLISSRRVTACSVRVGDREIGLGERVTLMWGAANRDERTFKDAAQFKLDRNSTGNLLYGAGIHVCPGAPLARLELRVLMEELLTAAEVRTIVGRYPTRAMYPTGGFSVCPVRVMKFRCQ